MKDVVMPENVQVQAELLAVESTHVYEACEQCSTKLKDGICSKCNNTVKSPSNAAVVKFMAQEGSEIHTVTMFTNEVKKLCLISPIKEVMEEDLLDRLPVTVKYTLTPSKDGSKVVKKLFVQ